MIEQIDGIECTVDDIYKALEDLNAMHYEQVALTISQFVGQNLSKCYDLFLYESESMD